MTPRGLRVIVFAGPLPQKGTPAVSREPGLRINVPWSSGRNLIVLAGKMMCQTKHGRPTIFSGWSTKTLFALLFCCFGPLAVKQSGLSHHVIAVVFVVVIVDFTVGDSTRPFHPNPKVWCNGHTASTPVQRPCCSFSSWCGFLQGETEHFLSGVRADQQWRQVTKKPIVPDMVPQSAFFLSSAFSHSSLSF